MAEHLYKVVEIIGASSESFEKAAAVAVETAAKHLTDLRIAEIVSLDMQIAEGKVATYRAKVKLSSNITRSCRANGRSRRRGAAEVAGAQSCVCAPPLRHRW
jgi:flavin-binding protein dodecin